MDALETTRAEAGDANASSPSSSGASAIVASLREARRAGGRGGGGRVARGGAPLGSGGRVRGEEARDGERPRRARRLVAQLDALEETRAALETELREGGSADERARRGGGDARAETERAWRSRR